MLYCWTCKKELDSEDIRLLQRRDVCPHCRADLRCCYNCRFWDGKAELCREGNTDFVRERNKANFCSQFSFDKDRAKPEFDKAAEAKARLASLFKKP